MMSGHKGLVDLTVAVEIEGFLSGKSDGAALFQALYGAAVQEPVPERLLAVLRAHCAPARVAEAAPVKPVLDAAAT